MIIKGLKNKNPLREWMLPIILAIAALGLAVGKMGFSSKGKKSTTPQQKVYSCNAEVVQGEFFVENGVKFKGGNTQAKGYARSGNYACKLDSFNQFGITLTLNNVLPGQTYKAEVWRYTKAPINAFLVASAPKAEDFYAVTDKDVENDGGFWGRMELVFTVPKYKLLDELNVYVYKEPGARVVLFDDFRVTLLDTLNGIEEERFEPQDFSLKITPESEQKIIDIKERAFKHGVLIQTDEDWIKAKVTTTNGEKGAKVRLKGDWLDHLFGQNSSFRVQLKSEDSWLGMQTFSVQRPQTRGMLSEWVYHQMLGYVGVLSPRYDFINFYYNDKKPIIYAYEEHFTKNLVENQLRREGPIIKLTEDRFWEGMSRSLQGSRKLADAENKEKAFWNADIKPFKEGKTQKNSTLAQSFQIAQNLMHQYKYGLKRPSEVFDMELLAKYMAISDFLQAGHTLTWHNQRFYYNPITGLLEPIGFDGYGEAPSNNPSEPLYIEYVYSQKGFSTEPINRVFYDEEFMTLFLKYLDDYTQPLFVRQFLAEMEESITAREAFLNTQYTGYSYNRQHLINRAIKIQEKILPFSNSLQIFRKEASKDSMMLHLKNGHILPLEVIYAGKQKRARGKAQGISKWIFPQKQETVPTYTAITVPAYATTIHYRLPGIDSIFYAPIPVWNTPKDWTPRQALLATIPTNHKPYTEEGDLILFEKKVYEIKQPLILPKGKKVVVQPGTHFKFSGGGFLISLSPVDMRGDEEEPIVVESLDGKAGSFTVLQAKERSTLRHVLFKNQNTLAYKGWNLTGAVTFYESDVTVLHCRFIDNQCEDALNIIRSEFEVEQSIFQGIYGDAFDADFCKGKVKSCGFKKVANDALDFSTSLIDITACKMANIGDKGISAGEHATVSATDVEITNANIAFASKDLSVLNLNDVRIYDSMRGFAAYQKKPEYGGATINLWKYEVNDVKYLFMIEPKSVLNDKNLLR